MKEQKKQSVHDADGNEYRKIILYLIRHGKTEENTKGLYIGRNTDVPLAADELLCWPENIHFPEQVFVSPMLRCRQTAQMLAGDANYTIIEEFAEMDFGSFEGKGYEELKNDPYYQKWIDSNGTIGFPEGESQNEFVRRCMSGFEKMCRLIRNKEAMLVAHGGTLMAIMSSLTGGQYFDFQAATGTGYKCEILISGTGYKCDLYEEVSCKINN